MTSFKSLGLAEPIVAGARSAGYEVPTPIQASAIPLALERRDLIGCAQTGTGKTAAFVLPVLDRLTKTSKNKGARTVRALVVVPTRELALQVDEAVRTYGRHTRLKSLAIYGGTGIHPQIQKLRRGIDIVVATPGRLLDHMERGTIDLSNVEMFILDEADRMLDMGFIRDIKKVVAAVPGNRQTLFFSATMPPAVEQLAKNILRNPALVELGERRNPARSVVQHVCSVRQENKMGLLLHVLNHEPVDNVIVFSRTKHRADRINRKLVRKGFAATVMHSNRSQSQRQRALDGLQRGKYQILVATDIASRGIDLDDVTHVINYDTPRQAEDYIHRIGRTGRADASGDAITFVGPDEQEYLADIERHIGRSVDVLEFEGLTEVHMRAESLPRSGGSKRKRPSRKVNDGSLNGQRRKRGQGKNGHNKNGRRKNKSSSPVHS